VIINFPGFWIHIFVIFSRLLTVRHLNHKLFLLKSHSIERLPDSSITCSNRNTSSTQAIQDVIMWWCAARWGLSYNSGGGGRWVRMMIIRGNPKEPGRTPYPGADSQMKSYGIVPETKRWEDDTACRVSWMMKRQGLGRKLLWCAPITAALRSKLWTVFARSNTGISGLNPTQGMDLCLCCRVCR
jgi:hypothetical protein